MLRRCLADDAALVREYAVERAIKGGDGDVPLLLPVSIASALVGNDVSTTLVTSSLFDDAVGLLTFKAEGCLLRESLIIFRLMRIIKASLGDASGDEDESIFHALLPPL